MSDCSVVIAALNTLGVYIDPTVNCCSGTSGTFVTCDVNSKVIRLNWDNLNLYGSVSSTSLSSLTLLKAVDLSGNYGLTGLDGLCSSTSITWLDISNVKSEMTCFPSNLQNFYMRNNEQTTIPSRVADCNAPLRVLDISNNFVVSIPCSWSLTTLIAHNNSIMDMTNTCGSSLKYLDVSENKLTTLSCSPANANEMNFRKNDISSLNVTCNTTALTVLDAGQNKVTSVPSCSWVNMTGIAVDSNSLNDTAGPFDFLCAHQKVKFLNIKGNGLNSYPSCMNKLSDAVLTGNNFTIATKTIVNNGNAGFTRASEEPIPYVSTTSMTTKAKTTTHAPTTTYIILTTVKEDDFETVVIDQTSPAPTATVLAQDGSVQALLFKKSASDASALLGIASLCFLVISLIVSTAIQFLKRLNLPIIFGIIAHLGMIVGQLHSFAEVEFGVALYELGTL